MQPNKIKINIKKHFFLFLISFLFSNSIIAQLTNGNLEAGGSGNGFLVNEYTQINPLTGVSFSGSYAYTNNPNTMDASFISGGDHTTGSGKMLVYNGSSSAARKFIWTTSSTGGAIGGFTIGSTYTFSYWIKSVSPDVTNNVTRANIGVFFVGADTFNPTTLNSVAPLPSDGWRQVQYSFRATATAVLIRLWDINTGALGNDFALDDFSITPGALPLNLTQTSINPNCPTSLDGSITGVGTGGVLPYTFSLASSTLTTSNSSGIFSNLSAGSYTLSIRDGAGATVPPIVVQLTPPNDITVSATLTTVCEGDPTILSVTGSPYPYLWTANPADPSLTAANNTSTNPTVSPLITTTYTATSGVAANATNLVINGDFSMGDFGFVTDYLNYLPGTIPTTGVQGAYGIVTNPTSWFSPFSSCTDHTSSGGNMLVADGATTGTTKVWYSPAPITVIPGKNYTFSYFLAAVVSGGPAKLEVLINNVSIGPVATAPSTPCVWNEHSYVWNSGTNTTAVISIIDREVAGNNDFAIDDLYFRETPTCIYQKSVTISVNSNPSPTVGTITQSTCTTATGSVILSGLPSGNWTINPGGITGNTTSTIITGLTPGPHTFTVTNANGCVSLPSASVLINAALTVPSPPTIGLITQPTCASATGSVILSGLPTGNWTINPGAITGNTNSTTISGLSTANYTFTVTNSDGCTSSASANVGIDPQPLTPSAPLASATIQPTCLALGTIVVTAPLDPNYEYSIGGTYQAGLSFSSLAPNTYSVTVKDVLNRCVSLPTSVVVDAIPIVATPTTALIVQPSCLVNGSIDIASPLGIDIEYSNGGAYQSSTTFSNLAPNTYLITAKNTTNGCISLPLSVVIDPIPNAITPVFNPIPPFCLGTTITLPLLSANGVNGTWSPSFDPNITTTYTFTPDPGECATTATLQVVITPIPTVTATPTSETICSLQSTGISLSSALSGTTFNWSSTATDVNGATLGTGNVISQVLTSTGSQIGNVQYSIIPTNNGCSGAPIIVTVIVTPKPTLIATAASNSICSGSQTAINLAGSIPGSTNFSWNLIQNNVTGGFVGTGNVIAQTLSTITNSSGEAVYAITPEVNGCRGITTTFSIIVNPIPVAIINPASGQTLCSGQTTAISFSSPVINTIFNWTIVNQTNINGVLPTSGSGTSITQTLSVIPPSVGTVTYEVTPISNGCSGLPAQVSVNVNPIPDFSTVPTPTPICSGDTTSIVLMPSVTGTVLTWTVVQNGVTGALGDSGTSINQVLETTRNAVGNATYTIITELNGCIGTPISVTQIVNPLPQPSIIGGNICMDALGVTLTTYTLDSGLNNTDYTFEWFLNNVLQSGSSNTFVASVAGPYSVIATNSTTGCVSSSVFATVTSSVPATSISAVGSFAFDQNATITVTALAPNPNYQYALDYGALQYSNVFTNVNPGNHLVTVTDTNGCTNLSTNVFIIGYPTFFTPNNDGFNDYWNIIGLENQPTANIFIFDRYGKLLKQISSKSLGWDGTYLGALMPSSDYWFTVEYIEPFTTDLKVFKSHFSLKR